MTLDVEDVQYSTQESEEVGTLLSDYVMSTGYSKVKYDLRSLESLVSSEYL